MRVTAAMKAREVGLAGARGPNGYTINANGVRVGHVGWHWTEGFGGARGYHWYVGHEALGLAHFNSVEHGLVYASMADAKDAALLHVRSALKTARGKVEP